MIRIFTPSYADRDNVNAQNLTAKELVARLDPARFHVKMLAEGSIDDRIAERANTEFHRWRRHGNAARLIAWSNFPPPDIYFFPRLSPADAAFLLLHKWLPIRTVLVTYIVDMITERELTCRPPLLSCTTAQTIRAGDLVFGNSLFVSDTIRRHFGIEAPTIYSGVDRRSFFPPPTPRGTAARGQHRLSVLYAGTFQERKRVHIVIEQAARHPEADFILAGSGPEEGRCRELTRTLGCGNVRFSGTLPQARLGDAMRAADLFLFPSIREGHPQVLMQAAACGLPCIAMDRYRPDSVVDGKTGFLVADDDALARKLDLLLADDSLRRAASEAAIAHARSFDWDRIAGQWAGVFDEAVRRGRRACRTGIVPN